MARRTPEVTRRRIAVRRFEQERARALAAEPSALNVARLNYGGAGITVGALAAMSGVHRATVSKALRDPGAVSAGTLRRLAATLEVEPWTVAG